jgi:hypothetical protein
MESNWVPFLKRNFTFLPPRDIKIDSVRGGIPWILYLLYALILSLVWGGVVAEALISAGNLLVREVGAMFTCILLLQVK